MMKSKLLIGIFSLLLFSSCTPDFLDVKRDSDMVIPKNLEDFEALLDNNIMYSAMGYELGLIGGDEYYVGDGNLHSLTVAAQRNGYRWANDVYENQPVPDWNNAYQRILYANLALEGVNGIDPQPGQELQWNRVKGGALFHRAFNFFQLQQQFGYIHRKGTSSTDWGIPLRLESDVTLKSSRATVEQTYNRIIADLLEASALLPEKPLNKRRPSKQAACAALAKTFLQMEDYGKALEYADMCLDIDDALIDFNTIDVESQRPFPADQESNPEVIFYAGITPSTILRTRYSVDSTLLDSYGASDLRRLVFFTENPDGRVLFKGSYVGAGPGANFGGLAIDEVVLIRAECRARTGDMDGALSDVNRLRKHRYASAGFVPKVADDDNVLEVVLSERSKELVLRGTRWADLRRLNKDPRFARTLTRRIDGMEYTLEPNSDKYVWPIPVEVVDLTGMHQNPRTGGS